MLLIVDYGMGNLASVANAFAAVGAAVTISSKPEEIARATRVVLPGVGAFGEAMNRLREGDLVEPLRDAVLTRRAPCLGICLGMQLLADRSTEHGDHAGLGWIAGEVRRLEPADPALRVPHIGWNDVSRPRASVLFDAAVPGKPDPAFYFVHSFQFVTADPGATVGVCDYGGPVTAVVARDHVFGTQFHPEKSQKHGLALLRKFLEVPASC